MNKNKKLDELRQRYRKASSEYERKAILQEAEIYKKGLYQCYYEENGQRCKNYQIDCWCSEEHKTSWQKVNYFDNRPRGEHKLSIEEIQKRLREMGKHAHL